MRKFDYGDRAWSKPETFWQWVIAALVLIMMIVFAVIGTICWVLWIISWPFFKLGKLALNAQGRERRQATG